MSSPDKDSESGLASRLYTGGELQPTFSCPSPESLAMSPKDYNCRGYDANDGIKIREVDEKLVVINSPRCGADCQRQKAVGPKDQ